MAPNCSGWPEALLRRAQRPRAARVRQTEMDAMGTRGPDGCPSTASRPLGTLARPQRSVGKTNRVPLIRRQRALRPLPLARPRRKRVARAFQRSY